MNALTISIIAEYLPYDCLYTFHEAICDIFEYDFTTLNPTDATILPQHLNDYIKDRIRGKKRLAKLVDTLTARKIYVGDQVVDITWVPYNLWNPEFVRRFSHDFDMPLHASASALSLPNLVSRFHGVNTMDEILFAAIRYGNVKDVIKCINDMDLRQYPLTVAELKRLKGSNIDASTRIDIIINETADEDVDLSYFLNALSLAPIGDDDYLDYLDDATIGRYVRRWLM